MNFSCDTLTTSLARDELLTVTDSQPFEIVSQVGCLWVTMDNDSRDIVLEPGQRHAFAAGERALIVALKSSEFLIHKTAAQVAPRARPSAGFDLFAVLRRTFAKQSGAAASAF